MSRLRALADRGLDGIALKPAAVGVTSADVTGFETVVIDYEGREHLPESDVLAALARGADLRVTTPVRADGFDPLGNDRLAADLPASAGRVLVAGNPTYLSDAERARAIAPRLRAARERASEAWVGTESVERVALALGGPQFELLAPATTREVRALRSAGFESQIAVYAPVATTDDPDALLDALGGYVARRGSVADALAEAGRADPDRVAADGGGKRATDGTDEQTIDGTGEHATSERSAATATDATAVGRRREILLDAIERFALVGRPERIEERVAVLREAGVDTLIGYPARGIDPGGD